MTGFMRKASAAVFVFGLTWAGTIGYWRQTGSAPGGLEILAMLGLLPAGLFGGGWMLRSMVRRAGERAVARIGEDDAATAPTAAVGEVAATPAGLAILAAAVRLPDAVDLSVLLSRPLAASRPGLHPQLKDRDGLPVFAGFVADLADPAESAAELDAELAPRHRRALALLEPVLDELAVQAAQALPMLPVAEERVIAGWRQQRAQAVERVLAVECLIDADMPAALQTRVHDWLSRRLDEMGLDQRRYAVDVVPVRDAGHAWEHLHRLADDQVVGPRWYLLLSACSAIDPDVIERWQSQGGLYRSRWPGGRIPGEAAAGVLLANAAATQGQARMWLQRPQRAPVAGDMPVRQRARQSSDLAATVLAASALDAQALGFVISDAGVQEELTVETGQVAFALCPELDVATQCLPLSASTGMLDVGAPLALLAVAYARLEQSDAAVLVLGMDPPDSRWVALLYPSSLPETLARPEAAEAA